VQRVRCLDRVLPRGDGVGGPQGESDGDHRGAGADAAGPYAGVVGYFDFSGNLDTCITIRTIVAARGRAYVQAGAGIVADSVPEVEAQETKNKAEALLRAAAASPLGG
jgi:anthranilate synthase component I